MSASVDLQPLVPLVDLLRGSTNREIKNLMMDVMAILVVPNLKKEQLIDKLADHVRSSGSVADVCNKAVKGLKKDYLLMILRQYDSKTTMNMRKSAMIDHFISLNMPRKMMDGPCTAIVPYVAPGGAREADFPGQVVDFDDTNRKMREGY